MSSPAPSVDSQAPARGPQEQITFRFCRECSNMLYPKEDKLTSKLMFACRTCQYSEEAQSSCVFRNNMYNTVGETAGVTQDVGSDPTVGSSPFSHFAAPSPLSVSSAAYSSSGCTCTCSCDCYDESSNAATAAATALNVCCILCGTKIEDGDEDEDEYGMQNGFCEDDGHRGVYDTGGGTSPSNTPHTSSTEPVYAPPNTSLENKAVTKTKKRQVTISEISLMEQALNEDEDEDEAEERSAE